MVLSYATTFENYKRIKKSFHFILSEFPLSLVVKKQILVGLSNCIDYSSL